MYFKFIKYLKLLLIIFKGKLLGATILSDSFPDDKCN